MALFAIQLPLSATTETLIALGGSDTTVDVRVSAPAYLGDVGVTRANGFPIRPTDGRLRLPLVTGEALYAIAEDGPPDALAARAFIFTNSDS